MNYDVFMGQVGMALALGLGATGSALGIGAAGVAAAGAWAKDAREGKPLRFTNILMVSAPITQTFYAFIVMTQMQSVVNNPALIVANGGVLLGIGLATGLGELFSAWMQGRIGAAGCRMMAEGEGKGFAFILIALGIAESVGIFTLIFMLVAMPK